jgi:ATP-dependent helicase Lhr and Lhr-like helicase
LVCKLATCEPSLAVPSSVRQNWEEIEALVATIRGYVEFSGPVTASEIAEEMSLGVSAVFSSLEAIEGEGTVLRGRFRTGAERSAVSSQPSARDFVSGELDRTGVLTSPQPLPVAQPSTLNPQPSEIEWCHRRLLSRIHRLTVAGLRREIEAVDVPTFVRFLTRHQKLWPESRGTGSNAVYEVISQLQGLDIAASAWESDILPLRITDYKREWLDELSLTGEVTWGRLYPPARDPDKSRPNATLTRVAPVSICLREDLPWLLATAAPTSIESLGSQAQEVVQILSQRGAVFATDLLQQCRMLPSQLDDVLGELVTRGWVTADGFSGLRSLIREGDSTVERHRSGHGPRVVRHRRNMTGGRWTLWRNVGDFSEIPEATRPADPTRTPSQNANATPAISEKSPTIDQWAWQLLRRWGVVFRDLLGREPGAPRWWELLQVYRKLEARGEIRGGRFVAGVAGEQYALGDTIRELRQLKEQPNAGELVIISASDPLNLIGILGNDPRVPSLASNRIALFNGLGVGVFQGEVQLGPQCPKSLAPFISAQLRTVRTMAIAIPKATAGRADRGTTLRVDGHGAELRTTTAGTPTTVWPARTS